MSSWPGAFAVLASRRGRTVDTQFLYTFVNVVDRGSMAAAARFLNITPAAVAQQIRTLERELGVPLIARAGRTVNVTEEGARILERVRAVLRDVSDLRSVANDRAIAGELRLGACPTVLVGMLPDVLARMVSRLPQINVFIKPGHSAELYGDVERGELDAALVLQAPFELPKTCRWELLREEPLVVLVPEKFAHRDPHEVLASEPLIRYDLGDSVCLDTTTCDCGCNRPSLQVEGRADDVLVLEAVLPGQDPGGDAARGIGSGTRIGRARYGGRDHWHVDCTMSDPDVMEWNRSVR